MTEPWLCESLRLTALWRTPEAREYGLSWDAVIGAPPEVRESQPRQGTTREAGPINEGSAALELRTSPGRADWFLIPAMPGGSWNAATFPNVGVVKDALQLFDELIFEKAAAAYDVPRLALGLTAIHPAPDREASYAELTALLKTISPQLAGASEFLYQINRPRASTTIPGIMINRLSRWSSVMLAGVRLFIQMPPPPENHPDRQQSKPINGTRVELDLNTALDREVPIPGLRRVELLRELSKLGPEILENGDIP